MLPVTMAVVSDAMVDRSHYEDLVSALLLLPSGRNGKDGDLQRRLIRQEQLHFGEGPNAGSS